MKSTSFFSDFGVLPEFFPESASLTSLPSGFGIMLDRLQGMDGKDTFGVEAVSSVIKCDVLPNVFSSLDLLSGPASFIDGFHLGRPELADFLFTLPLGHGLLAEIKHDFSNLTYIFKTYSRFFVRCLEHSVGPGAISCSFQLQESLFINKPGSYCNRSEECWMIASGLVNETTKIEAGGVKASHQAHQGMGLGACPPESLFFGTRASKSSRGVKKMEYLTKDREWGA